MCTIIGELGNFTVGPIKEVSVEGKAYAISKVCSKQYIIDGMCGFAGGVLSHGHLIGIVVTCPRHGPQYDITADKVFKKPCVPSPRPRHVNAV